MTLSFLILFGVLVQLNTSLGIEAPSNDVTSLNKTIVEKMAEVLRLENETIETEEICGNLKDKIAELKKRIKENSAELNELERNITKNDEEIKKLEESVPIAEVDYKALKMERENITKKIEDLKKEVNINKQEEKKATEDRTKSQNKERRDLSEKLEELRKRRHHLEEEIKSYSIEEHTFAEKSWNQHHNLLELQHKVMTHKRIHHELKDDKARNNHELRGMEEDLHTAKTSLTEQSAHLIDLENAKPMALKELKQLREDLEQMKERDEINRLATITEALDDLSRFSEKKGALKVLIEQTSLSSINKTIVEKKAEKLRVEQETTKTKQEKENEMKKVDDLKAKIREMRKVTEIITLEERSLNKLKRKGNKLEDMLGILSSELSQIDEELKMKYSKEGGSEERRDMASISQQRRLLNDKVVNCIKSKDTIIKKIHEKESELDALSDKLSGCNENQNMTNGWRGEAEQCVNSFSIKLSERERVVEDHVKYVNDLKKTKSEIDHELVELADKYQKVEEERTTRRQELGTVSELHQTTLTRLKTLIGITK